MDFGIAVEPAVYHGEKEDTVPGTPQFLAPELLRGERSEHPTDIYAMGVLLYEMFTGRVPFDDPDTARLVRRDPRRGAAQGRDAPAGPAAGAARDPGPRHREGSRGAVPGRRRRSRTRSRRFEGQVLDRVLAEVSVTRAKMVKLMVILEANKSLAATFDPTETLRIILRTATSETDAERGTIFLREPGTDELVSQILEGGAVAADPSAGRAAASPAPWPQTGATDQHRATPTAIRGSTREVDASSGFTTRTILAAPLRTPTGEIVGVVELLNKRSGAFTKEDEEFLGKSARTRRSPSKACASTRRRWRGRAARARWRCSAARRPLLAPPRGPRRRASSRRRCAGGPRTRTSSRYAVEAAPDALAFLLVETRGDPEESFGALLTAVAAGRPLLAALASVARSSRAILDSRAVRAASRPPPGRSENALRRGRGGRRSCRLLLRDGRPVPGPVASRRARSSAEIPTRPGRPARARLRAASRELRFPATADPAERALVQQFAPRIARATDLPAAFAQIVAEWKKMGASVGAARRAAARRAADRSDREAAGSSSSTSSRTGRSRAIRSPSFRRPSGLSDGRMQSIAREMDHAATAFLFPSKMPGASFACGSSRASARSRSPGIRPSARISSTPREPARPLAVPVTRVAHEGRRGRSSTSRSASRTAGSGCCG